jgi:hypothetical protein
MTFTRTAACTLAVVLSSAAPAVVAAAAAQETPARPVDRSQLRHQIYVMEGALSRAVEFGAQSLSREIRAVMPEAFMLAGQARARGVYLDGYGVFFDVDVPIMRQSMIWSLRTILEQDAAGLQKALSDIRAVASKASTPTERQQLERAISRIEIQLGPFGAGATAPGNPFAAAIQSSQQAQQTQQIQQPSSLGTNVSAQSIQNASPTEDATTEQAVPKPLPIDKLWMKDPNRAYTEAVQRALVDAMIDYSAPVAIGAEEWLTVAARDNYQRDSLAPPDPLEEVETVLLRISGADLMAYRAGQIDREEARKRVVISAF